MPSTDNTVPPQASYKPGSFSPELYEHYYETYRQQRTTERKVKKSYLQNNVCKTTKIVKQVLINKFY